MLIKTRSFFFLLQLVVTKLSLETIRDVVKKLDPLIPPQGQSGSTMDLSQPSSQTNSAPIPISSTIINPIFGYLFESTGMLSNIRYYGPELNFIEKDGRREYASDTSKDPVTDLIISLFPLPLVYFVT
jgi:hypothetical protein